MADTEIQYPEEIEVQFSVTVRLPEGGAVTTFDVFGDYLRHKDAEFAFPREVYDDVSDLQTKGVFHDEDDGSSTFYPGSAVLRVVISEVKEP